MFSANREELRKVMELKARLVKDCEPLPDEPDFFTNDETLLRYLRSRDLKLNDAEKMIRHSIEWRRKTNPLNVSCELCYSHPGAHSFRMVGFDGLLRPVLYSSFTQASKVNVSADDVNLHLIYTMENAIRCMVPGVFQWVIVFDCSGMSVASCNPKLGRECTNLLSFHYPERLAHALCLRPSAGFKAALVTMKAFMPPVTAKKVHLIKYDTDKQLKANVSKYVDNDMADWIVREVSLNGRKAITAEQRHFWLYNGQASHDPRGTEEYVKQYLDQEHFTGHRPHVNIAQASSGHKLSWSRSKQDEAAQIDDEEEGSNGHQQQANGASGGRAEETLDDLHEEENSKGGAFSRFSALFTTGSK